MDSKFGFQSLPAFFLGFKNSSIFDKIQRSYLVRSKYYRFASECVKQLSTAFGKPLPSSYTESLYETLVDLGNGSDPNLYYCVIAEWSSQIVSELKLMENVHMRSLLFGSFVCLLTISIAAEMYVDGLN